MNKVTLTAVTIAFGAFMATIPAQAEYGVGGVQKQGNRCFVAAPTHGRDGFGHWEACPQTSSTSATVANNTRVRHHASRSAQ